jgi:outer membrane protein TolC
MTRKLLAGGQANVLQVLTAQQQYAQASSSTAQARAVRLSDTVLLFQALGGGWNNGPRSEG